jgi:hypothetical protein
MPADELAWFREMYDEIFVNPKVLRLHFDGERDDGTTGVVDQILGPELAVPEIPTQPGTRTPGRSHVRCSTSMSPRSVPAAAPT